MGFFYKRLPKYHHPTSAKSGFPVKVWVALRRAAIKVVKLRRHRKKVTWAGLLVRVRKAMGLQVREKKGSYDLMSYARNFDDGVWKEDEEFWRFGSFAYRFGNSCS